MSAVKEEAEPGQDPGASAQPAESPGVYRSLRKRPNLNYAQAAGYQSSAVQLADCPTPMLFGKHNMDWRVKHPHIKMLQDTPLTCDQLIISRRRRQ